MSGTESLRRDKGANQKANFETGTACLLEKFVHAFPSETLWAGEPIGSPVHESSERKPETELNLAFGAEPGGRDLAEVPAAAEVVRETELRVVEEVEEFGAEFEPGALGEVNLAEQRKINIGDARRAQEVSRGLIGCARRFHKRRRVNKAIWR